MVKDLRVINDAALQKTLVQKDTKMILQHLEEEVDAVVADCELESKAA